MLHSNGSDSVFFFVCALPLFVMMVLFFRVVGVADAIHPLVKRPVLRYMTPASGCSLMLLMHAVTLRLPRAEKDEGFRTWWVLGVETVSNQDVVAKFSVVLVLFLLRGSWTAWRHPGRLVFLRFPIVAAERPASEVRYFIACFDSLLSPSWSQDL